MKELREAQDVGDPKSHPAQLLPDSQEPLAHLHKAREAQSPKGRQELRLRTQREGQLVQALSGLPQEGHQGESVLDPLLD